MAGRRVGSGAVLSPPPPHTVLNRAARSGGALASLEPGLLGEWRRPLARRPQRSPGEHWLRSAGRPARRGAAPHRSPGR